MSAGPPTVARLMLRRQEESSDWHNLTTRGEAMTGELKCTSCGADLEYSGNEPAITCNYCGSVVIVPEELRGGDGGDDPTARVYGELATATVGRAVTTARRTVLSVLVMVAVMVVAGASMLVYLMARTSDQASGVGTLPGRRGAGYRVIAEVGGEGPGPGLFLDPRAIAVQGNDHVYVSDFETGRIQVFDTRRGDYITQWTLEAEHTYINSLAATPDGILYVLLSGGEILAFDGMTGDAVGELTHPESSGFEDVATGPEGSVVVFWWSFEDFIARFDADGLLDLLISNAIGNVTGDSEMDGRIAVDGLGDIYVLGGMTGSVFRFSREGVYRNRFGSPGDAEDRLGSPGAIAVSPAGDVYVSDWMSIKVFGGDGRFLRSIGTDFSIFDMEFDYEGRLWVVTTDDTVVALELE